jgi:hypothetical protein
VGEAAAAARGQHRGVAALFAVGSSLFAIASFVSQWASASRPGIGVTFFAGSLAFTSAAFLQLRSSSTGPQRDRRAALIQFAGTLFFNVSTFAAMRKGLDTHETDLRVWAPDMFGSACFLIASELSLMSVCGRWACWRTGSSAWRVAALNMVGSILFGISAVASLIEPSTSEPVSAAIANAGTTSGALCFLGGALLMMVPTRQITSSG